MKIARLSYRLIIFMSAVCISALPPVKAQEPCTDPCQLRFALYGDTRSGDKVHRDLVSKVVAYRPMLILQTGDLVLNGGVASEWKKYDAITAEIRNQNIPFYPARGNHDVSPKAFFEARVPAPTRPGSTRQFYAFDQGNIRFIAIDTNQSLQEQSAQRQWLKSELSDARAAHKFILPYFHTAIYSIGHHGSDLALRKLLHPLFIEFGVRLVFQGHDHNYYRTRRDGITYIVSGGGGAGLYAAEKKAQGIAGDKFEMANNFTIADVFADGIVITTYASRSPLIKPYRPLEKLRCATSSAAACEVVPF